MKFRICWRSNITGCCGEGQEVLDRETARTWRNRLNGKYAGTMEHWTASGSVHNYS